MSGWDPGSIVASGLGAVAETVLGPIIRSVFPDPKDQLAATLAIRQADFAPLLEQIKLNAIEAASEKWWKAGWRPFIGWVCGFALFYHYILYSWICFLVLLWKPEFPVHKIPVVDWTELAGILLGMLGLGYQRTDEKKAIIGAKQ